MFVLCLFIFCLTVGPVVDRPYTIRVAAQKAGLSPHVIRVWERRYLAVEPRRTGGNQRHYTAGEVERLRLLAEATRRGHSIGAIARVPEERLRQLVAEASGGVPGPAAGDTGLAAGLVEDGLEATRALDGARLHGVLERGAVSLGQQGLLRQVVAPLIARIGSEWFEGRLTIAQEHFASAIVREHLLHAVVPYAAGPETPIILVGTPPGQHHELGAALVAAAAASAGWRVAFLGTGLPASEFAGAAAQCGARVVALSLVHPEDDPRVPRELARLRKLLPAGTSIMAGGRAAGSYRAALTEVGAIQAGELSEVFAVLQQLRASARSLPAPSGGAR